MRLGGAAFRGDTDDARRHATSFIGREIGEIQPEPRWLSRQSLRRPLKKGGDHE